MDEQELNSEQVEELARRHAGTIQDILGAEGLEALHAEVQELILLVYAKELEWAS